MTRPLLIAAILVVFGLSYCSDTPVRRAQATQPHDALKVGLQADGRIIIDCYHWEK